MKLSELKALIRKEYKEVLSLDHPEDVKSEEDAWAGGENLVGKVDHKKAYKIKEQNKKSKKLKLSELRDMILTSLQEHRNKN
tara:strand:+ start:111 stop:356 length:246 start_codon:yes stop_codon:yes gene_type:complete